MISFTVALTVVLATAVISGAAGFFAGQKYALKHRDEG
jgi:hypothetical protein